MLKRLWKRWRLRRDLEEELQFHLDRQAEVYGAEEARRRFGNPSVLKETLFDMWTFPSLESWLRDVRFGVRKLAAAPGFTLIAVIALGLGIGADTAMFSIIEGALTWNLGLDHQDRIVFIDPSSELTNGSNWGASYPDFRDFRDRAKSIESVSAYRFVPVNVSDASGLPERFNCVRMSANGFRTAEVKPALGRDFIDQDEQAGAEPVLMLSHTVWQDRYGSDPQVLGKVVRVDEVPHTIIGVMPPNRRFPEEADLWTALPPSENRNERGLMIFGRIGRNTGLATARAEMDTIAGSLAAQYPANNKGLTVKVLPIAQITGVYAMRPLFAVLFAAVGFVLLIACVDVANLLLARGAGRQREMAVRMAIGAGKARILRQLLIESMILSLAGGVVGGAVAFGGLKWFDYGTGALASKPVWLNLSLDSRAFAYLAAVTMICGILFGLAPALRLAGAGLNAVLKDGGPGTVGGRFGLRLSRGLVVFEMMLCVILLTAAGLMIRSAVNLYATPIGANPANVLTARVNLPKAKYPDTPARTEFHRSARASIESLPGLVAAAVTSNPPMNGWRTIEAELPGDNTIKHLDAIVCTAGYFRVLEITPSAGHLFADEERSVVVNDAFVNRYWPEGQSPLGRSIRIGKDWLTVSGVIPTVLQDFRNPLARHPLIYVPYSLSADAQMYLIARTAVPPTSLALGVREQIRKIDGNLALYEIRSLEQRLSENRLTTKMFGVMMTVFASVALVLASIGLYSVVAHSVSLRSQEIGVRMALGGSERDILKLVFRDGMRPLVIGLGIGLPLSVAAMRALRTALVGVAPDDPLTFGAVVLILLFAGALGCVLPARRAMGVDPVNTLRCL